MATAFSSQDPHFSESGASPPARPRTHRSPARARWERRLTPAVRALAHHTFAECLQYSVRPDPARIGDLRLLYARFAWKVPPQERLRTLIALAQAIEHGVGAVTAFLPFIYEDPDPDIVATASLQWAVLADLVDGDPLTGPRSLRATAEATPWVHVKAGLLSGLLLLGDQRTAPLLAGCWHGLEPAGQRALATAWSGFAYASVIEFFLTWLEQADPAVIPVIAGTLIRLRHDAVYPRVLDVERTFPVRTGAPDPPLRIRREWTFEAYGALIVPRLQELADREPEPRVLSRVAEIWSPAPKTPPEPSSPSTKPTSPLGEPAEDEFTVTDVTDSWPPGLGIIMFLDETGLPVPPATPDPPDVTESLLAAPVHRTSSATTTRRRGGAQ